MNTTYTKCGREKVAARLVDINLSFRALFSFSRLQVGKTTVIKSLVKHYTRRNIGEIKGPITVVSGT